MGDYPARWIASKRLTRSVHPVRGPSSPQVVAGMPFLLRGELSLARLLRRAADTRRGRRAASHATAEYRQENLSTLQPEKTVIRTPRAPHQGQAHAPRIARP